MPLTSAAFSANQHFECLALASNSIYIYILHHSLGNNEEERNNQREETNPEKNQDMHDGNEKEHLEDHFNESNDSKVEICGSEKQPISKIEQLDEMKTDQVDTGISCEKNVLEAQQIEHIIYDHQELRSTEVTENIASHKTSHSCLEEQPGSIKEDSTQVINMDTLQSDTAAKEVALAKEVESDKPTVAASNIKDLETVDGDSEGVSSKSQGTSAGGKKKKRKKRGKKKGSISEDKNVQNKEKVIAEQDSNCGLQVADGNFTDHDCHNIHKDLQTELAKTSQESVDKSGQIVKETGAVSKIEKDSPTNCLDENAEVKDTVPFLEVNSTSSETTETAIDSTHIEVDVTDMALSRKSQCSDDDGQGVQSEAQLEMHDDNGTNVDQMDSSDKAENVVADNVDEENQPSADITSVSEVAQQKPDVESEQTLLTSITQISSSENNVQNNVIERSLVDNKAPELAEKSLICENEDLNIESTILNSEQGTNLRNEGTSDEPIADDAVKVQVTDRTVIEDMSKVPDEKTSIEEEKIPEITAFKDDKQLKLSPNDYDGACSVVELTNECSEEVEEALGSVCVDQISEVGFDVTVQVTLSNKQTTDNVPQESDQNGNEELDVVDAGTEIGVICDSESAVEEPNDCNSEKSEVLNMVPCGVNEVEVGVDVLVENDISKEQFTSGDSDMISQNIKSDPEPTQSFVDRDVLVEENSLNQTNNSETHVLCVIENGHEALDVVEVKTGSDDQEVCQDIEQPVSSVEVESKLLDEIGLEVLVEDSDTKDRSLETHVQVKVDDGTFQTDISDTESTNAVVLVKDDPEAKATPADEKVEIGVEGQVEDNAKEESNSESLKSQSMQNSHKHLEDLSLEPQSPVENTEASHVESPRQKMDVEASQCIIVGQVSEDEDEGEGLSFDFDDLEMEAAIALGSDFKAGEEEVELGVEVLAEEEKDDLVDKVESQNIDNDDKEQDETCNVAEFSPQNDDSDSLDSASLTEKSETSQEQIGASSDHTHIVRDPIQDSSENIQSSQKDKCRDGSSGENRLETNASSGQARSGKESKKSSKKGKGKSKDECKMT